MKDLLPPAAPERQVQPPGTSAVPSSFGDHLDAMSTRRLILAVAAIVLLHTVLGWLARTSGVAFGEDDAAYLQLARGLRHFTYRDVQDIAAPIHARFPPGYPIALAAWGLLFGDGFDALIAYSFLCTAVMIALLFDALRRTFGWQLGLLVITLVALNPLTMVDDGHLMSEAQFKMFGMLTLWSTLRERDTPRFWILSMAAAVAAAMTRTAGVVLVLALFAYWVWDRHGRRVMVFTALAIVSVGAWVAWTARAPDAVYQRLYTADWKATVGGNGLLSTLKPARLLVRLRFLGSDLFPFALSYPTVPGTIVDNVFWLVFGVVVAAVGCFAMFRRWRSAAIYSVSYLALLVLWRFVIERFLTPLIPLVLVAMAVGLYRLTERIPNRWRMAVLGVFAGLMVIGSAQGYARIYNRVAGCDRTLGEVDAACLPGEERDYLLAARWVRDSTSRDAIFFVPKERAFYFHTGRKTINQDRGLREDSTSLAPFLRARGVSYAVATDVGVFRRDEAVLLAKACRDFDLVRVFGKRTAVVRLRDPGSEATWGAACEALASWRHSSPRRKSRAVGRDDPA